MTEARQASLAPDGISDATIAVLAMLLNGDDVEPSEIAQIDTAYQSAALELSLLDPDGRAKAFARLVNQLPEAGRAVGALKRAKESRVREESAGGQGVRSLPEDLLADLQRIPINRSWVDEYVDHAAAASPMTPSIFHESAALWLASTLIARRLVVHLKFDSIFPNLYVVWIAPTTLFGKTTALVVAKGIARDAFSHLLAPQDTTPEALLADMAGEEPVNHEDMPPSARARWRLARNFAAQRGWVLDEVSGLIAGAGKDYNAGLIEMILRCYDCDAEFTRSTRKQGWTFVRNAYLTILGATTPAALAPHFVHPALWAKGLWPRFAVLVPEVERPDWQVSTVSDRAPGLVRHLFSLDSRLPRPEWPEPATALVVEMTNDASDLFDRYTKAVRYDLILPELDERLRGTYGRLPVTAVKVATILAALDWARTEEAAPNISVEHMAAAIRVVETWRRSAHRAVVLVSGGDYQARRQRLLALAIRAEPRGITLREMCKQARNITPDQVQETLRQMVAAGDLSTLEHQSGPKGGRPTDRYRAT